MVIDSKHDEILRLMLSKKSELRFTEEDEKKLTDLWKKYYKKTGSGSSQEVLAGAVLWTYSKINFLWETDKSWSQQHIADMFITKPKTISNKSREIINALKIKNWDERFCRKEVYENSPFNNLVILPESGYIVSREQAEQSKRNFIPLKKTKEDYFYEGIDSIGVDDRRAANCFRNAMKLDDEYVDAYNGMGEMYFSKNLVKSEEYYKKAFELSLKHFKGVWSEKIKWGVVEQRMYLRAMQGYGLVLWRKEQSTEAMKIFKLMLTLNKNDNQGVRYLVAAIYADITWQDMEKIDEDNDKTERLFYEQNKKHKFF